MIPTTEEIYGESFRAAMNATAPPCPSCGESELRAEFMPEVNRIGHVERNGDMVTNAVEIYRCRACGERAARKIELDRTTQKERDQEIENAIGRSHLRQELRRQYGILGLFAGKRIEAEVQDRFSDRADVDLLERWRERR